MSLLLKTNSNIEKRSIMLFQTNNKLDLVLS